MAEKFGNNPQVARQMSQELAAIRADMESLGHIFDGFDGATGSARIESALDKFHSESSDNRKKMDALLQRASGLLAGLAEGTTTLDNSLADALTQPAPGQGTGPQAPL